MLQKNNRKIKPSSIGVYVGLDFVGDGLIKLPFIRSLRQVFPNSKITWIAGTHKSEFNRTLAPLVKGLIDEVLEEPLGGAHRNSSSTYATLRKSIISNLRKLKTFSLPTLLERRYKRLISYGSI